MAQSTIEAGDTVQYVKRGDRHEGHKLEVVRVEETWDGTPRYTLFHKFHKRMIANVRPEQVRKK